MWSFHESIVWGSCGEGMRNRLQTLQSRAARVVTSSSYDRRSAEILDELGWDNFQTRRTGQFATIISHGHTVMKEEGQMKDNPDKICILTFSNHLPHSCNKGLALSVPRESFIITYSQSLDFLKPLCP
ncbi:unnamed protein product [Porites lobata]|uniref:Uncharacterized protein n=1 Tax=Porites lobata TaxID=104759 RepID=A0ABN8RT71_9CNID|nr:unnamed protein product [Porites lobata]